MNDTGPAKRGRPPGLPKTGGRTRGTPNKSTLLMRARLVELGCDPLQELLSIARKPNTTDALRTSIYWGFVRYTYAAPKPVTCDEENQPEDTQLTIEEALEWAHYLIDRFDPDSPPATEEHGVPEAEINEKGVEDCDHEEGT